MKKLTAWFNQMSFGESKRVLKIAAWCFFDSFWNTLTYAAMMMAIYLLLLPLAAPDAGLPTTQLWLICGLLVVQFIGYLMIRRKTYMDVCVGMSDTAKISRIKMGEHLRRLPMGFYSRRDAGDLSTVLLRDYNETEQFAGNAVPQMTVIAARFLMGFIMLTAFDWRMMLAAFIVVPLSIPFVVLSYKGMTKVSAKLMQAQQDSAEGILEYVGGIQTLKAFHLAGDRFQTLQDTFRKQHHASIGLEMAGAPVGMLGRFVLNCGASVVMLVGALLLTGGSLDPFYYAAFLLLSLNLYEPLLTLFFSVADFSRTNRSLERIEELKNEKLLPEPTRETRPQSMDIRFEHVHFGYGKEEVLHDITLTFPEKSVTALVGPSGSGKSTVTRLVARFWDVSSGKISLGGIPITQLKTDTLLSYVSMVFQDVYLFHDTIEANIRMGKPDATMAEIEAAAQIAACHDFIIGLPDGYQTIVGEGGSTLSGGEKQRISIARALLKDAPMILLDEATASLDPENEVLIQQAISALVKEKTVIVIAHRLQSICNADQIVVLEDGTVKECGSHTELLAQNGLYAHLWDEQNSAEAWQITD